MGSLNVIKLAHQEQKAIYFHRLVGDIEALDKMVSQGLIEKRPIRIGAEQEFCLVDHEFLPDNNALEILNELQDSHFTTEIGNFNLEINLDPIEVGGSCFAKMHEQLNFLMEKAKAIAANKGSKIVTTGILPTLCQRYITLDNMTSVQRYYVLNEATKESRAQDFSIHIKGVDEITLLHDNIMLESCNTSFQMHLQVNPDEFIDRFNWAQAISGPILSVCCNSPLLFGKELWSETRISLFTQSVDLRANSFLLNEGQARVSFENNWLKGSIADIFKDYIARFRSLVTVDELSDSLDILDKGGIPKLDALALHNGTVYRWNRACYGVGNGKPHLRIENRYIPAGPTAVDQIANMAFWVGVMHGRPERFRQIEAAMDFKDANSNFYQAARYGLSAQFKWDGKVVPAKDLILHQFLPMAYDGLKQLDIAEKDITHYLQIIENRIKVQTGSEWLSKSYRNLLKHKKRNEALQVLTAHLYHNQEGGKPVSEWETLTPTATTNFNLEKRVRHIMNVDLLSADENDSVELVIHIMKWKNIHHMPIIRGDKELIGMISWTDVVAYLDTDTISNLSVQQVMKTNLITITENETVTAAKALLEKNKINSLLVVNGKKLIGILTTQDIS